MITIRNPKLFTTDVLYRGLNRALVVALLSIVLMLINSRSFAQIVTLNNWSNEYHGTSNNQNLTYAVPTGSNTHRMLVVAIATSRTTVGARAITLTYGGQALTSAGGDLASTGTRAHTELYYLNEAGLDAAGSTTLAFSVTGGTTRVNDVFVAVFDGVDQTLPITDSQNYSSADANTTNPVFGTALNINANGLAIEIISAVRVGNTTPRNITYATNWTMEAQQTFTTTDGVRNAVANRSVPISATTDNSSTTFNGGGARGSMTALSLNAYVPPFNSWYSYQSGNFNDFNTWTLDPSGTTFDNFLSQTPANGDEITILNGFTVTYDISNRTLLATTIQGGGILDMAATTGHDLGVIAGTGILRVGGVALPSGTYTDFVSTLGGTIEYYNIGGNLPTAQTTYNNLMMTNSTGSNITYVLVSDLTVNGTFDLSTTGAGTVNWQINDLSNTQRTITLHDDLTVAAGGRISVGGTNANNTSGNEANAPHALTMNGNIVNNGIIRFFYEDTELLLTDYGLSYPAAGVDLHRNELQGNAVTVTFSGTNNKTVTCNNTTDFYRFVVDKGTGQQAILTVNSSNTANFRLFGPSDLAANTTPGNSYDYYSDNALSLLNGTLELTGNIDIPHLTIHNTTTNGYFALPRNATLWLNGAGVTVTLSDLNPAQPTVNDGKDGRILIGGLLRVTAGTINGGFSKGLGSQDGGAYLQEGGTVNVWQFRSRAAGTGVFSFNQTGGTLNVGYGFALSGGTIDQYEEDFFRFDLRNANCTFQMSGSAVLNVAKPTFGNGGGGDGGLFYVGSSTANYNVTGGTVNFYTGFKNANSYPGFINSTAPLYNVNLYEESATTENHQLQDNSLVVLNNLTINTGDTPSLITNNLDITVGGNFTINTGTTYTPGTGTTTFNGTGAQTWTHSGTITALASVVMNKSAGTLTLAGSQTFPNITTALTLTSGTLADGGKTVTVTGTLSNSATHSGSGVIVYNNAGASTISGNNGTFGNLTVQTNATVATSGGQTVTGTLRLVGANTTLNIGSHVLNALGNIYSNASPGTAVAFTATKRILTSGLHNAGGLTRQGVAATTILFPVGTGSLYTPASISVTAGTHGTITVRPVASQHPNVTTVTQSVRYYWRVTSTGYVGISAVTHSNYNYSTAVEDNPTANYRAARYDADLFTWATSNTVFNATTSPPIPTFNTGTAWAGVIGDRLDGEYTCGNVAAFGNVTVYFSKASGNWNATTTWSNDPVLRHAGADATVAPPCATCPVVIGDGSTFNHIVTTVANSFCGSLALNTGSTLDCSTFTGHNFGTNTGGAVSGRGRIRINSNVFPPGDFTNFIGVDGGTVEWYGASKTIPTIGGTPQFLNLPNYYNLVLNPSAGQTITLPATNLTTYNDLTIGDAAGFTGTVVTNGARTIAVTGNLTLTRGVFNFSNAAASATTMSVNGNLSVANGTTFSVAAGGTSNANTLAMVGNITNDGTMNFNNTGTVALTFSGSNNVSFSGTGSGGTTLFRITINKGSSNTPTVTFDVGGTVNTTPVALGWLTLTNGTFDWANPVSPTTLSTTTYTIGQTTKLRVSAGTLTHSSGDADANDLFLNGALEVAGGAMNVGNTTVNGNNVDIEYASAGVPAITVSSGALWVKGSIRRSASTITGALAYTQTSGTVTVGGISSTDVNSRGVFEIDANTGSSFTLTGTSSLIVERQTGGAGYADLYINPLTSNVSSTSTITVGVTTNNAQANFRINVLPAIGNFTIRNGDGNDAQTVNMFSNPIVVGGTLTIPTPSVLNTNSLDVSIAGDLICTGTYSGGTNNTTFNGTAAQAGQLSASSTFNDFTINKTAGTTLTLSGTSPTLQNLYILSGILDVGPLALDVRRNITNNSSQIGTGSILIFSTTPISNTITSSGGAFTNLTLGGTATTKSITVDGNTTINGILSFPATDTRYFYIGSSQLTFGESAGAVVNAGSTRFIRTNGVSSDLGVVRSWPVGTSTFAYTIGTSTNYTPVSYSLNVTTPGALNVIPVNSAHPTYNQLSAEQILNYYWSVSRVGSTLVATASGNHTYSYPSSLITGSGGALVAGYLDGNSDPLGWVTSGHGGTATTTIMTFTNAFASNLPSDENFYDYSVGTTTTLPSPIQPLYSRFTGNGATVGDLNVGGDWTNANNWTTSSDGNGPASAFAPTGVPVVILPGARINTGIGNGRRAFRTTINGLLDNGTRTGHNLGIIDGTGTFRSATNTFPAGNYTAFVSSAGGTIEYVAPMTMNNRTTYNHLSIYSGSAGTVAMTASNLTINGNVTIPSGTTLSKPNDGINLSMSVAGNLQISGAFTAGSGAVNANVSIAGNWINSGTYSANTGTVTFNGTTAQSISGTNPFYGLAINKASNNVTLSGAGTTSVSNSLLLTSGHIISSATNTLALGNATSSPGSSSSFVSGPLTKTIGAAGTFVAPLGSVSANRYRPATIANTSGSDSWSFEYVGNNPTTDGYTHTIMNIANIGTVSMFEYWLISRGGATTANATLSYNTGSYIPPDIGTVANLRVARWDGSQWDLPPTSGGVYSQSGSNTVGTVTVTNVTAFSPLALASTDFFSPLPIELLSFTGRVLPNGIALMWETASEINNHYFVLERSIDNAETFKEIARLDGQGTTNQQTKYSVIDQNPTKGKNYYRLKQVDFNGDFSYADNMVVLYYEASDFPYLDFNVYPNPTDYKNVNLEFFSNYPEVEASIVIYNMQGKVVFEGMSTLFDDVAIALPNTVAQGIYLIEVSQGKIKRAHRLMIK